MGAERLVSALAAQHAYQPDYVPALGGSQPREHGQGKRRDCCVGSHHSHEVQNSDCGLTQGQAGYAQKQDAGVVFIVASRGFSEGARIQLRAWPS